MEGAGGHPYSRASCARLADVECQHVCHVRGQQMKGAGRHLYSRASCARATEVESRQAPLLASIMCVSSRCRSSTGTSTREHQVQEQQT